MKIEGEDFHKILNDKEHSFYKNIYPDLCEDLKMYIPKVRKVYTDEYSWNWLVNENLFYNGVYN